MMLEFNTKLFESKAHPGLVEIGFHCIEPRNDYEYLSKKLNEYEKRNDIDNLYQAIKGIAEEDFFAFCFFVLGLPVDHPFLMARIYEQCDDHDHTIDLHAREHWKSTIGSFALPLWRTVRDPENRTAIFSYNRGLAISHLRIIKIEMEQNVILQDVWSDIFYKKPKTQSSKWSEHDGLYVKREGNYPAATFEAWGLVDNMPTGKHFSEMIFDDIVDPNTVTTPGNIRKAVTAFRLSDNLGTRGCIKRIYGTRYKFNDPYSEIMDHAGWKTRIRPAEVDHNGDPKRGGIPVYLTAKELQKKYEAQGPYIYFCQMLQFPVDQQNQTLHPSWVSNYSELPTGKLNYYIVVDSGKKKRKLDSLDLRIDPSVMWAFCVDGARNTYILDGVRDKLDLRERWEKLRNLAQKWGIVEVGYEQYGAMSDVQYMEIAGQEEGVYLHIIELGGKTPKTDRILSLVPDFKMRKIKFPKGGILYERTDGTFVNLVDEFIKEEYENWPFSKKDDMLDCLARKNDPKLGVVYPAIDHYKKPKTRKQPDPFDIEKDDFGNEYNSWELM